MLMNIEDRPDGITFVTLEGSLDLAGTNQIDLKFQSSVAPRRRPTIISMSGVGFISSLAMGMLVATATSLRRNKHKMVLLSPQPAVEEALRNARIDMIIPIVRGLDEAVAAVAESVPAQG